MEKYCVKRAYMKDWGYKYSLESIMEHIMNQMAKDGWMVRSTCYNEDYAERYVIITFAKQV